MLVDDGVVARFGAALAWADRADAASLDVLVDGSPTAPGIVARRASSFASPALRVWAVAGRALSPAVVADPVEEVGQPDPDLVRLLSEQGLEVVWEHGVLRGEILGLEVARTVGDRLEVGVGRHDRNARLEMRPGQDPGSALAEAASVVRSLRRPGAPPHPANTLARSRWLRALAVRDGASLGLADLTDAAGLTPVAPPLPWFDLPEAAAAPAVGRSVTGSAVVVVFSVGVDVDLVPTASDTRLLHAPAAELVVVVPEGDDLPVTRSLRGRLNRPASLRLVPHDWAERTPLM